MSSRWIMLGLALLTLSWTPAARSQDESESFIELAKLPTRIPASIPAQPGTAGSPTVAAASPFDLATSPQNFPAMLRPTPVMLGDYFAGRAGNRTAFLPRTTFVTRLVPDGRQGFIEVTTPVTTNEAFRVYVPGGSRQFKIGDNESPMPLDRLFVAFNYFNDYNSSIHNRLGVGEVRLDEYRAALGFEKTFWCGAGSIGLRVPLIQSNSRGVDADLGQGEMGDLSFIFKYAPWRDSQTGDVVSVGLAVTAPTGTGNDNPFHGTLVQPFLGVLKNCGQWYVHGFVSVEFPVQESDDVTLLFTDLGVGYRLWSTDCGKCLTAVTPTAEVHVNTPLNHRGILSSLDPAGTPDTVDFTLGSHFDLGSQARLTLGAVLPVTGPRPFQVELMALFNMRF